MKKIIKDFHDVQDKKYKLIVTKPGFLSKIIEENLSDGSAQINVQLREYGDINDDGEIDVADLSLTSGFILSNTENNDENTEASDYNRDDVIDVTDLSLISS